VSIALDDRLAIAVVMDGMVDYGGQHGQATAIAVELARRCHQVAYLSRWPIARRSERAAALVDAGVAVLAPYWSDAPVARIHPGRYNVLLVRRRLEAAWRERALRRSGSERDLAIRADDANRVAVRMLRRWKICRAPSTRLVLHVLSRPSAEAVPRLRELGAPIVFSEFGELALYGLDGASAEPLAVDGYTTDSPDRVRELARLEGVNVALIPCMAGFGQPPTAIPDRATSFVVVNRLADYKRTEVAMHAVARDDFELHIHGGGPEEGRLRELVAQLGLEQRVRLHGFSPREHVLDGLDSAHAFISCSRLDGTPMAVLEAMSRGRAIVAYPLDGIRFLVRDGVEGLYFDGTPDGLAAALRRLAGEAGLAARLGRAGRERWERQFAPAILASEYERLYHGVLARRADEGGGSA